MWLYVAEGAVRAGSDHGLSATLALIEVAIALVLFTTCCIHIRARCAPAPPWPSRRRRSHEDARRARGERCRGARHGGGAMSVLDDLRAAVGAAQVLVGDDGAPYEVDWRRRFHGRALAVVRPGSTAEVAAVVKACRAHGTSIVAQGGNTGLVGGSVPDASGRQVVLSTARLNRIRSVDATNLAMVAEAGCVLQRVQEAAAEHELLFAAQPRRRGQLHDRRQPRDQRRRHAGRPLRQRARAVPRPRGRHRRGTHLGRPVGPAQGQHRLRPARPPDRQRRHARHHHRGDAEAASAAARQWRPRWRRCGRSPRRRRCSRSRTSASGPA